MLVGTSGCSVEDAGDGVAGGDEIPRQLLVDRRPARRGHAGGEVPAGRVAGDDEPPLEARELAAGGAQLLDDVADPHLRAEVVAGDRDVEPVRVRPARQMAEERRREVLPVAAMDEDDGGGGAVGLAGVEEVDELPLRRPVGDPQRRVRVAIGLRIAGPALDDRRMLRHPGAVVVLGLVIDRRHRRLRRRS